MFNPDHHSKQEIILNASGIDSRILENLLQCMDSVISIHTYLTNAIMTIDIHQYFFPWPMYLTIDVSILLLNVCESAHENEVLNSPKSDKTSTDVTELNVWHTKKLRAPFSDTKR